MRADWTQPPFVETPGDLGSLLADSRLMAIVNDRDSRSLRLRFALPPDAGTPEAKFAIEGATHLLAFAYLPPAEPLREGLTPEEAMATVGDWARRGLIVTADPLAFETPLVVQRAALHVHPEATTMTIEGYGEDPDRLVWWEVRVSGTSIEAC